MLTSDPPAGRARRLAVLALAVAVHLAAGYALLRARAPQGPTMTPPAVQARILEPSRSPAAQMPALPAPRLPAPAAAPLALPEIPIAPVREAPSAAPAPAPAAPASAPSTDAAAAVASAAPAPSAASPGAASTPAVVLASSCDKPEYPAASRRANESGSVLLNFLVDVDGKVIDSKVERSSGYRLLDEAALAGLALCRFKPATLDGRPARAWARIQYVWRLE